MNFDNINLEIVNRLFRSRYGILYIVTMEEDRIEYSIRQYVKEDLNKLVFSWCYLDGFSRENKNINSNTKRNPLQALEFIEESDNETPSIYILKNFDQFLNDVSILTKLKMMYQNLSTIPKTIIIISSNLFIPLELKSIIYLLEWKLPSELQRIMEISRLFKSLNVEVEKSLILYIAIACQGLTLDMIRRVISYMVVSDKKITEKSLKYIYLEKKQIYDQYEYLEYFGINPQIQLSNIGGYDILKNWLDRRRFTFDPYTKDYGAPLITPRGLLLAGLPGNGKEMFVRAISTDWNLQLIKLNFNKFQLNNLTNIDREHKLIQALRIAETIGHCIVWLNDGDKLLFNVNANGFNNRFVNIFKNWLREKGQHIFVVVTVNEIDMSAYDIFCKGNFDEMFFLDIPSLAEREEIYKLLIDELCPFIIWEKFNYYELAVASEGLSGAEIRQSIINAMYLALSLRREITTKDIKEAIFNIFPISKLPVPKIKQNELTDLVRSKILKNASKDLI